MSHTVKLEPGCERAPLVPRLRSDTGKWRDCIDGSSGQLTPARLLDAVFWADTPMAPAGQTIRAPEDLGPAGQTPA